MLSSAMSYCIKKHTCHNVEFTDINIPICFAKTVETNQIMKCEKPPPTSDILWKTRFIGELCSLNVEGSIRVKATHVRW